MLESRGSAVDDDEAMAFLGLIAATDSRVDDTAPEAQAASGELTVRGGGGKQRPAEVGTDDPAWKQFYASVVNREAVPTMLIDFEYKANNTLERMYCFSDGTGDYRVVLHVHTLEQWPDPTTLQKNPTNHARRVTSANIRVAVRVSPRPRQSGSQFSQDGTGHQLVGVRDWRWRVEKKLGHTTEWVWSKAGDIPQAEPKTPKVKDAYDEVRKSIDASASMRASERLADAVAGGGRCAPLLSSVSRY
jgi:hypothetical protein